MKNSAVLRPQNDFKEIQFAGVVIHIDGNDGTRPRPSQEVLVTCVSLLAQAAHFVYFAIVKVDVE